MLKEYKAEQDEQALKYGDKWVETDRLYTKWNGEPMQNGTPYFWLNEFCAKHGLPFYGIHSFRHQYVKYTTKKFMDVSEKIFRNTQSFLRKTTKGADKPHLFSKCCHCY